MCSWFLPIDSQTIIYKRITYPTKYYTLKFHILKSRPHLTARAPPCASFPTDAAYLWSTDSALERNVGLRRSEVPDELIDILVTRAPRCFVPDTCHEEVESTRVAAD